ncbi:hypothetical protein QBC37DRAFT_483641 [Rhypophila decipiens]|uniref:Uncharacterized protein n=1 Tax=Rhypophila decipiens TaxID=261697 RepID=A0AAN7B980_9PEZI|nr:hypothetical protein QBC37DRAFT_483641 [Rhypophila decipiens]
MSAELGLSVSISDQKDHMSEKSNTNPNTIPKTSRIPIEGLTSVRIRRSSPQESNTNPGALPNTSCIPSRVGKGVSQRIQSSKVHMSAPGQRGAARPHPGPPSGANELQFQWAESPDLNSITGPYYTPTRALPADRSTWFTRPDDDDDDDEGSVEHVEHVDHVNHVNHTGGQNQPIRPALAEPAPSRRRPSPPHWRHDNHSVASRVGPNLERTVWSLDGSATSPAPKADRRRSSKTYRTKEGSPAVEKAVRDVLFPDADKSAAAPLYLNAGNTAGLNGLGTAAIHSDAVDSSVVEPIRLHIQNGDAGKGNKITLNSEMSTLATRAKVAVGLHIVAHMALKTRKQRQFGRGPIGMNLAEISMRNWVIPPSTVITDAPAVRTAAMTSLGIICLVATFVGTLYTTAPDALVSPNLKFGVLQWKTLQTNATASCAYLPYTRETRIPPATGPCRFTLDYWTTTSEVGAEYHLQDFEKVVEMGWNFHRVPGLDLTAKDSLKAL